MEMTLTRIAYNGDCTIGELRIDGQLFCHTLEPTTRFQKGDPTKKVFGKTSIDSGTYDVTVDFSPHFGKELPHILNVPCFEGVRMHGGNTSADTEGCVLCGTYTDGEERVWNCAPVIEGLTEKIKSAGGAKLTVIDGQPA
jgi:Family of unknown function (DUF5675)